MNNKTMILAYVIGCVVFLICMGLGIFFLVTAEPVRDPTEDTMEPLMIQMTQTPETQPAPTQTPTVEPTYSLITEATVPETTRETEEPAKKPADLGKLQVVYCIGDRVNVRKEPNTSSKVLGKLKMGQWVDRIQDLDDGWTKILYENAEAYVSSEYLSENEPKVKITAPTKPSEPEETKAPDQKPEQKPQKPAEPKPTEAPASGYRDVNEKVYCNADRVNIRTAPKDGKVLGKLSYGDSIHRLGVGSNGWSRVIFQGREAYVSSDYLTTKQPEPKK